jgi:hypothetical protein
MFGHLKAEDFVHLMEGGELSPRHKRHIDACARCRETWESMGSMRAGMVSMEMDIPEPDWDEFRASVRDALLSRSVRREAAVRRWTGWTIRPAMAWALSLVIAVALTTVTVLWKIEQRAAEPAAVTAPVNPQNVAEPALEIIPAGPARSLFAELVSLGEEEQERFRKMLESAYKEVPSQR